MGMIRPVIYTNPESLLCRECRYGEHILECAKSDDYYICNRSYTKNTGGNCKKMLPKDLEDCYDSEPGVSDSL